MRICPTLDSHLWKTFDNNTGNEIEDVKKFVGIDYVFVNGFQLLLNRVYDRIGFGQIKEFERIIKLSGIDMSVENIAEIKKGTLETHPFQILYYEKIIFHG